MTFNKKEHGKKYRAAHREQCREYGRQWRAKNPEKVRESSRRWRAENPEKTKQQSRNYRTAHPERVRESNRKWTAANREKVRGYLRKWKTENPEKYRAAVRKWKAENPEKLSEQNKKDLKKYHEKNRNNPIHKMHQNMRSGMNASLKGRYKSTSTMKIIGCTVEELFEHLESCVSWESWMTRENYGKGGWDVDHIIAITKWDYKSPLQLALCWDKSNLQPMEHIANIKKGGR